MIVSIPVSLGYLFDRISILLIKKEQMAHLPEKLVHVEFELNKLEHVLKTTIATYPDDEKLKLSLGFKRIIEKLKLKNERLWYLEDKLRKLEKERRFDGEFVKMARAIYTTNDERNKIISSVDEMLCSDIKDQKLYETYR